MEEEIEDDWLFLAAAAACVTIIKRRRRRRFQHNARITEQVQANSLSKLSNYRYILGFG